MTLLFLTPYSSSEFGGVERHVRLLKRELEKREHRIIALSIKRPGPAGSQGLAFKNEAWRNLWRNRHLIEQADLVHIHDVFWWYLPFRFLFPNKPVFTTFHGWEGVYPPMRSAIFQKKLAQWLSRGTVGVGNFFEKWYGIIPTHLTFGALDPRAREVAKRARIPEKIKRIAFFGRLESVNGIDIILPVLSELRRKHQILYVGDGSWRDQAEKVGRVTGMVKDPWIYLLKSDLVITSSYLSMLETAALARPIISITTNLLKCDYLSTHPLAPLIAIVSSSEELLETIRSFDVLKHRKKIQAAQYWTLEQTPRKLADLYEKLWKDEDESNVSGH